MAKKTIRVYSLHPNASSLELFLEHYHFAPLQDKYDFVWDEKNPEYLFVGEHWFSNNAIFHKFKHLWQDGRHSKCVFIGFYEEATKPDTNLFDYVLGYDADFHLGDRIGRINPVHSFMDGFVVPQARPAHSLDEAREWLQEKKKFCNFLYSHAFFERDEIFRALNKYKPVDALGARFHNTDFKPTGFQGFAQETTTLRYPYKFTIAGENGTYDGYTSEKLMTALQANTVPIYWGHPRIREDFNPKAFINARDFASLDELVQYVRRVDEDADLWCQYICEPWQTEEQVARERHRLEQYYTFFDNIFRQPLTEAKRLEYTSHMHAYQEWIWRNEPPKRTFWVRAKGFVKRHLTGNKY